MDSKNQKEILLGIDIGGTKCAVVLALACDGEPQILGKECFLSSLGNPDKTIETFFEKIECLLEKNKILASEIKSIGISCGGPLDSELGIIQSPPNLPKWDNIEITKIFSQRFGVPAFLENDANACALAEWLYGAGKACSDMIFLTFGTGLGAGLIMGGKLQRGANGNAGEVGHVRLEKFGPVGYAKEGSFEGFCSGSGIAQLGATKARELLQSGKKCSFCADISKLGDITAKDIAMSAENACQDAIDVLATSGKFLGKGLSMLVDILNPQKIVIGSVFARAEKFLRPAMEREMEKESLLPSRLACEVVAAKLGEKIGDIAALSVAANALSQNVQEGAVSRNNEQNFKSLKLNV